MSKSIVPFSKELAQELIESGAEFPVDFELAWQWLGYSRKDVAARKLKQFKEGRDFRKLVEISATKPTQRFWLTIECFKSLGMMAQTEQGDKVRNYFLECEKSLQEISMLSEMQMISMIALRIESHPYFAS